jgi:type II secretory pathway pseudopilin PulG
MIVIAIIGLVVVVTVPGMTGLSRASVRRAANDVAVLLNEAAIAAQSTGRVYRLVYSLESGEYWAESSARFVMLESEESKQLEQRERTEQEIAEEEELQASFILDSEINRRKRSLPVGVRFKSVLSEQDKNPITKGLAYTHIFPQGQTEKGLILIVDNGENIMSVRILGLLGKSEVEGRELSAQEAMGYAPK